jgi:hypothetical protein
MSRRAITPAFLICSIGLAACAPIKPKMPPSGQPIALSPATQGELAAYLQRVKVTRPRAFAISADGRNSFYTWCKDIACATLNYVSPALWGCRSLAGMDCFILYVRHEQRLLFTHTKMPGKAVSKGLGRRRRASNGKIGTSTTNQRYASPAAFDNVLSDGASRRAGVFRGANQAALGVSRPAEGTTCLVRQTQ